MKYLKKFESVPYDNLINPKLDDYVKDLFKQYLEIYDEDECVDCDLTQSDIIKFFDELNDEIEDSQSIEIYKVDQYLAPQTYFYGLSKAYGPLHACIKVALALKDSTLISDKVDADIIMEEQIQSKIRDLEEEIREWKTIY